MTISCFCPMPSINVEPKEAGGTRQHEQSTLNKGWGSGRILSPFHLFVIFLLDDHMHVPSNLSGIVGPGHVVSIRVVPQYYVTESCPLLTVIVLILLPNRKLRVIQTMLFTNLFAIPISFLGDW